MQPDVWPEVWLGIYFKLTGLRWLLCCVAIGEKEAALNVLFRRREHSASRTHFLVATLAFESACFLFGLTSTTQPTPAALESLVIMGNIHSACKCVCVEISAAQIGQLERADRDVDRVF
jgi:hypothetical protein